MNSQTVVKRKSDREVVVTRTIDGPPGLVWEAWTRADLFKQWWVPKSFPITLQSCAMDVRVGGTYRLVFAAEPEPKAFFGKYLEVKTGSRLVWTNEEDGPDAAAVTTVTFEERDGKTLVTMTDLHPTKEALDASGATDAAPEVWDQLQAFITSVR